jgi:hypothetical protein
MHRLPWSRLAGLGLLCTGLLFVPGDLLLPPSDVPTFAVAGAVVAALGAPLVFRREEDGSAARPALPSVVPTSDRVVRERERVLFLAIHDVRRMIQTMHPDELLVSHIDRRLSRGVAEAGKVAEAASAI